MASSFDPVTLEILWRRLISIVDEADASVYRTAFSSLIRDAHDYTNAIFDRRGREIAEGTLVTPGLLGALANAVGVVATKYSEAELKPGDVLISNDPWLLSGHLNDICLISPIFYEGKLTAFTACIFHHADIGGRPGAQNSEVFEEGLFIPLCKLVEDGIENEILLDVIRWNVRRPDDVMGDLRSQMAANHVCSEKIVEMMADAGLTTMDDLADEIIGRTEDSMRNAILELPDGVYSTEAVIEGTRDLDDINIRLRLQISGNDILVDFDGTDPQVRWGINTVFNFTYSYVNFAIKSAFNPDIFNNHGSTIPVRVVAPEGSIVNCRFPAAVAHRTMVGHRLTEIVYKAIAPIAPTRILAECGTAPASSSVVYGERHDGRKFLTMDIRASGMGASSSSDGLNCSHFPTNSSNTPSEVFESDTPIIVEAREMLIDTGGAGRRRGGLGQKVTWRIPCDETAPRFPVTITTVFGRMKAPAAGSFGGRPGAKGRYLINGVDTEWGGLDLCKPGDVITFLQPGGGGYGDPFEREPELVELDVLNGYVSREAALLEYGVVIDPTTLKTDDSATRELRSKSRV